MSFLAHPQKFRTTATKKEEKTVFLCYNNDCYKISISGPDVVWAFFSFWAKRKKQFAFFIDLNK